MSSITRRLTQLDPERRADLDRRLGQAAATVAAEPIAVVGAGCRLPGGADSPGALWRLLSEGRDAVTEGPDERWDVTAFYDRDPRARGRSTTRWGAFLDDVAGFDAAAFGIAPAEAAAMDPQARLLLEVAWEALEHAGIVPDDLTGTPTGVFAGLCHSDYLVRLGGRWNAIDAYTGTGTAHSVAVGRVSYLLGLNGPSVAVDTACSSSLVAVHLACQSLRLRECELALAGGANLMLSPEPTLAMSSWGIFSPTGRCRAFDASADGMVRGEGAAVVALKRLTDALRDGDRVLAVVRGSAVNSDGRSQGLTAPHPGAQRAVIRAALAAAGVDPGRVGLIETHGTGTPLGDPIEFGALADVYGAGEGPCALGAVKGNIGHTEATAGVAGLLKAVLALRHGAIPPNLHFHSWNPKIDPAGTRFHVPTEPAPWTGGERYAAVSSFGISGTNAHLLLEQPPAPRPVPAPGGPVLVPLSATSPGALRETARRTARWLREETTPNHADVAHTLAARRAHHATRAFVTAHDTATLADALDRVADGATAPAEDVTPQRPVWVFSGQGSQLAGMGGELLDSDPAFARAVAELEPLVLDEAGFSVTEALRGDPEGIDRIQPALFATQIALAAAWRARGVEPAAVIGQSMGEVAAAVVAGALTLADGVRVICRRSRLLRGIEGRGAMASVDLPAAEAERDLTSGVSVAVVSSPGTTIVAGDPAEVAALVAAWTGRGLLARTVAADVASHSPQVDPLLPELTALLTDLDPRPVNVPCFATTGHDPTAAPAFDAAHWAVNLREPVRLAAAVRAAHDAGHRVFLEISPHPVLTYAVTETLGDGATVLPTLHRDRSAIESLRTQLGRLYLAGVPIDWRHQPGALADAPTRTWDRRRHWIDLPLPHPRRSAETEPEGAHPLLGTPLDAPTSDGRRTWRADLGTERLPWLDDHRLHEGAVLPGAGFCELALAAGAAFHDVPPNHVVVSAVRFERFLALTASTPVCTTVIPTGEGTAHLEVHTRSGDTWLRHATADLSLTTPRSPERADLPSLVAAHSLPVDVPSFYARLRERGYDYGPAFTGLRALRTTPDATTVLAQVSVPAHAVEPGLHLHPILLDVCFHGLGAAHSAASGVDSTATPHSVGGLRVHGDTARTRYCRATVVSADVGALTGHVTLLAADGTVLAELHDVHFRSLEASDRRLDPLFHRTVWTRADRPAAEPPADRWTVLGDAGELPAFLDLPSTGGERLGVVLVAPRGGGAAQVQRTVALLAETIPALPPRARLWLVTRGACGPDATEATALRGLARVLMFEHEDLRPTLVDLDPAAGDEEAAAALAAELLAGHPDDEVMLRHGTRHVARLENAPPPPPGTSPVVRPDAAYVITGGMGGIGVELARWLTALGARHLVLAGRSERAADAVRELRDQGVRVDVELGDLAAPGMAERLFTGRNVRGVLHAAAVVDDAALTALTPSQVGATWRPKAVGALRLHEAAGDLDWFVMFSSGSAVFGSMGLGAYAAANAWLDGFAVRRRAQGLPALSVNWGAWGETGLAVELGDRGYATLPTRDALDALRLLLEAGPDAPASVGVFPADPDHWLEPAPSLRASTYFSAVVEEDPGGPEPEETGALRHTLAALDPADRPAAIRAHLTTLIRDVLALDGPVPANGSLVALGFDSLSAMRLRRRLQHDLGVQIPATVVWTHPSLDALADHLLDRTISTEGR